MVNQYSFIKIGRSRRAFKRKMLYALLIAIGFAGLGATILIYRFPPANTVDLEKGDIARQNIVAPRQATYVSESETKAARDRARNAVQTKYSPPDPQVARQQVNRLRKIFDYMDTVRADPYASRAEKFEWISAIPDLSLSDTVIDQILIMNDQEWNEITRPETLDLLRQAMSAEIRDTQVIATRRQLPTKVSLDIPEQQASVIVAITEDLIKPNTFPDEAGTEAERQTAVAAVEEVMVTVGQNELIISAGQVVGPRTLEALDALGLDEPRFNWIEDFAAPAMLMLLTTAIMAVYIAQYMPGLVSDTKRLLLLALFLLAFIALAKFVIPSNSIIGYLYPMAALAMIIVILIDAQLAFILTTMLAFLVGYVTVNEPQGLIIYLILSGWAGALALGRGQRVNSLIWAGVYVGLINTGIILIFNLSSDRENIAVLLFEGLLNGILLSTGLTLISLLIIGNLFGITTHIQLTDLGRPTQPLLRQLLLKAPGTYHHSLMVSNLAEQAAERIGADSLLVRVMAYYHDIGKMQRPYFFIENQPDGMANIHEKLEPQISAQIIISHVKDGLDLANKYRLPPAIKEGIAQHHGTSLVKFFYYQAVEAAKEKETEVDEAAFRYPGPKPQTKENGILMLADGSESAVRALKPRSTEEIDEIVQKIIAHHLSSGQLDECHLTIADLHKIRTAFVDILQGVHHPRIKYPGEVEAEDQPEAVAVVEEAMQPPEIQTPEPGAGTISPPIAPRPAKLVQSE
jgi:putative nucleotidyltransferase with HDIG domain